MPIFTSFLDVLAWIRFGKMRRQQLASHAAGCASVQVCECRMRTGCIHTHTWMSRAETTSMWNTKWSNCLHVCTVFISVRDDMAQYRPQNIYEEPINTPLVQLATHTHTPHTTLPTHVCWVATAMNNNFSWKIKYIYTDIRAIFQGKRSQVFRFTHINCAMSM